MPLFEYSHVAILRTILKECQLRCYIRARHFIITGDEEMSHLHFSRLVKIC